MPSLEDNLKKTMSNMSKEDFDDCLSMEPVFSPSTQKKMKSAIRAYECIMFFCDAYDAYPMTKETFSYFIKVSG